jgi:hypothetical protein
MRSLAILIAAVALLGCGSSTSGGVAYALPGGSNISIAAGDCVIVNAAPQTLPASTVSYTLTDGYTDDSFEVGVVPSTYTCQFDQYQSFVDDHFAGSATDAAAVPPGTYDLDVICQNAVLPCLIADISWSATY